MKAQTNVVYAKVSDLDVNDIIRFTDPDPNALIAVLSAGWVQVVQVAPVGAPPTAYSVKVTDGKTTITSVRTPWTVVQVQHP